MHTSLIKVLVIVVVVDALGWGLGILPALQYALVHGSLRTTIFGIRGLSGPFEALGIGPLVVAGLLFVAVSAMKLLAAYWIWNMKMDDLILELILLGLSMLFWYGFALPLAPIAGIAQIVLIALAWRTFA